MNEFESKLHRTWVQLLLDNGHPELAAIALESEVCVLYVHDECYGRYPESIAIGLPTFSWIYINNDERNQRIIEGAMRTIIQYNIFYDDGRLRDDIPLTYRVKLVEIEEGWQNIVKNLIANSQNPNQAVITEKVFVKKEKNTLLYNEMKFASKTEIRIAQELENRKILFFPLPLAVRADTGNFYNDHREVDFLICQDGTWGILEVSFHQDRYEKDSEKDSWFKKSGILCIQHYTAERCWNHPQEVVDEFLSILAQYKR
ncbi:MAG: hypothetical protein VKK07_10515 [Merismopediaceae bacterium]|nr:hypothetical protein [Merismopediaceae bacterium]